MSYFMPDPSGVVNSTEYLYKAAVDCVEKDSFPSDRLSALPLAPLPEDRYINCYFDCANTSGTP